MTIEQLNYVLCVYNNKSINKAAQQLFVSQSSISQAIKQLENEIGTRLFIRTRKGVEITPFGLVFIRYITPIQAQIEQLNLVYKRRKKLSPLTLSIAGEGFRIISDICIDLLTKYEQTGLRIELYDSYETEARTLVANGTADVGFVRFWSCYREQEVAQMKAMGLSYTALGNAKITIKIGKNNPLYTKDIREISPELLANYTFITNGHDYGPHKDILSRLGIPESNSKIVTASRAVAYDCLNHTNTYTLDSTWPEVLASPDRFPENTKNIPLKGINITSERGWIIRKNTTPTPIAQEFIMALQHII